MILPSELPLFILQGVVLPPRFELPFYIFEPRYRAMIQDVRTSSGLIGLIQPDPGATGNERTPPLMRTGCAGLLTSCTDADEDGCYHIALMGMHRFTIKKVLEKATPYRCAEIDYSSYGDDLKMPSEDDIALIDRAGLILALDRFLRVGRVTIDPERVKDISSDHLVNLVTIAAAVSPREKQAALEAASLAMRGDLLIRMSAMMDLDVVMPGNSAAIN